jgi:hypothetical protein
MSALPQKRTFVIALSMYALCHERTWEEERRTLIRSIAAARYGTKTAARIQTFPPPSA